MGNHAEENPSLMSRFRGTFRLAALVSLPLVASSASYAAFRPRVSVRIEENAAALLVNDRLVARLRTANGGLDPSERANAAGERLQSAVGRGLAPAAIGVRKSGSGAVVVLGQSVLLLS